MRAGIMQDQTALNLLDGADVRKALAGDQAAFASLYNRYFTRVYDFLARMLRDSAAAEDVTQETFIQAMTALPSLKKPEGFKSWLFTIARNQALNRLERGKRVVAMPTTVTDEGEVLTLDLVDEDRQADPAMPVLDQELASLVWEAAQGLDEKSYSILDLHVRQGLDSGEIAQVLGVTKGNAYTMLSRVKDRFEESLAVLIVSRRGRQACEILQGIVVSVTRFTQEVRERISKHIKECETCSATRKKFVVPFNVISGLAAPLPPEGLKERIWEDLISSHWPPGSSASQALEEARLRRWGRTLRRRWPISAAAVLLLLIGLGTSFRAVLGNTASSPPMATVVVAAPATIVPPTVTSTPVPTFTAVPPTLIPPTVTTVPLVVAPSETPTPVPDAAPASTDTPEPATVVPDPATNIPARATSTRVPPTPRPPTVAPPTVPPTAVPAPTDPPPTDPPPTAVPIVTDAPPTPVPPTATTPVLPTPVLVQVVNSQSLPTATFMPVPPVVPVNPVIPAVAPTATFTPTPTPVVNSLAPVTQPTATFTPTPTPTFTPTPTRTTAPPVQQPPAKLSVAPASGSRIKAPGAFTITNTGGQNLTWSATVSNGYTLSSSGGTLAPGKAVSVSVSPPPQGATAPGIGAISISSNGGGASLTAF